MSIMRTLLIFFFLLIIACVSEAETLIGGETLYTVEKGDSLELISAKLGVSSRNIMKDNGLDPKKRLRIGQELRVNTRRIVPKSLDNGIIINIPEKRLYFFRNGGVTSFPVGLGLPSWRTPTDKFKVTAKEKNPTWYVPKSIQNEMAMKGKPVETIVPPGPDNPLGKYAVKTSLPGILIHETIWPTSVYQFRSHGCIRVLPQHIEPFFQEVAINTPGEILYIPVKVALSEEGRVFIEVHRDGYKKIKSLNDEARGLLEKLGVSHRIDWARVEGILKEKSGIAEDITL